MVPIIVLAYPKGDVDGNGAVCANDYLLVRKLYYKKKDETITKRFGGDRKVPDLLYFVEK